MKNSEKSIKLKEVKKVLENALEEVLELTWEPLLSKKDSKKRWQPDLVAKVKAGRKEHILLIEFKTSGEPRNIAQVAGYMNAVKKSISGYPVLVAPFVSSRGRKMCKELGLGFVDLTGNAYLKFNSVLIERWGKESKTKETRLLKSLFTEKSTWTIRKMFSNLNREWKMEELANESNVSLGQAYKVITKLEAEGFVDKKRGAITLSKPKELLDAWAKVYNFENQSTIGYYCPLKDQQSIFNALRKISLKQYALTLGAAASLVAPFVRSTDVYMYIVGKADRIVKALRLKPVEFGGNVHLVTPADDGVLFAIQQVEGVTLVSNLQLYLDLYNYPMRGREQAEHLRNEVMRF